MSFQLKQLVTNLNKIVKSRRNSMQTIQSNILNSFSYFRTSKTADEKLKCRISFDCVNPEIFARILFRK